jgi:hypothetical protein
MRFCGRCRLSPRHDDPGQVVQHDDPDTGSTVTLWCCSDCMREILGFPAQPPTVYHTGTSIPMVGGGFAMREMPLCGVCRRALREDDRGETMRLAEGDGPVVGCFQACRECIKAYTPMIHARLQEHPEQRANAALPPLAHFNGNWLM